jgi:nucleoporin NDC1
LKAYALWELAYISRDFEDRRKAIFEDIDRKEGPVWSQIYGICIDIVKSVGARIDERSKKPEPPPAPKKEEAKAKTTAAPKDDDIFHSQPTPRSLRVEAEKVIQNVARSPGETPYKRLSPIVKRGIAKARDRVLTKEHQEAFQPSNVWATLRNQSAKALRTNGIGEIFAQTYRRGIVGAVLGAPEAEPELCVNAVTALTRLAVTSLGEDKFGNVHRDVPTLIRTFTMTIRKIEIFKKSFPLHWSDVEGKRESPEVDIVLDALRAGLGQLVDAFEPYRNDLRLTLTDIRVAKEAAGGEQEVMVEVGPNGGNASV